MKILVTGADGQLGREFQRINKNTNELVLVSRNDMDITDHERVRKIFAQIKPDAVVHCAAYTQVDKAESDFDSAFRVNVVGTQNIASQCLKYKSQMVYVSTDYVFDGKTDKEYREYDKTCPINCYGKTKLLGEMTVKEITGRHFIVRTAWLYGDGKNFTKTMLKLASERQKLQVVNDQFGSPTFTRDLATTILRLLSTDAYGTYHASCNGTCTWYDFAKKIFSFVGSDIELEPINTDSFPTPAKRPLFSVLDNYMLRMTIGDNMRYWEEALEDYLQEFL